MEYLFRHRLTGVGLSVFPFQVVAHPGQGVFNWGIRAEPVGKYPGHQNHISPFHSGLLRSLRHARSGALRSILLFSSWTQALAAGLASLTISGPRIGKTGIMILGFHFHRSLGSNVDTDGRDLGHVGARVEGNDIDTGLSFENAPVLINRNILQCGTDSRSWTVTS